MNIKKLAFVLICMSIQGLQAYSIVFIHIGSRLPEHIYYTISQARLFNEECSIFLIADREAIQYANSSLKEAKVVCVPSESLPSSKAHIEFITNPKQDWSFEGLWVYSSERFFYLEELIRYYNLLDVFHIESDVLLYANLGDLLPVFKKRYEGMLGAVFENDNRCVPSILYTANLTPVEALIKFYPKKVHMLQADMEIIADFKEKYRGIFIDFLPITFPEYAHDHPLISASIHAKTPELYWNNVEEFQAIFDGAAFGIYLAGWNSRWHPNDSSGTISEYSVVNPSFFNLDWRVDSRGRKVPWISYGNREFPLVNLHITNKSKIDQFLSEKEKIVNVFK